MTAGSGGCGPALAEALKDQNFEVRLAALEALGTIGPKATPAVPALAEALKDKGQDPGVRFIAASALFMIGPKAAPALDALIEALKDQDPRIRLAAAGALGTNQPEAAPALDALIEALKDHEPKVREAAARALGAIGPKAAPALDALIEALKDQDTAVRTHAANALADITIKLQNMGDVSVVNELKKVQTALVVSPDVKAHAGTVSRTIESLEISAWWRRWGTIVSGGTGALGSIYLLLLFPCCYCTRTQVGRAAQLTAVCFPSFP